MTNLIANASFEDDLTGWGTNGTSTLAASQAQHWIGSWSVRMQVAGGAIQNLEMTPAGYVSVPADTQITISVYMYVPAAVYDAIDAVAIADATFDNAIGFSFVGVPPAGDTWWQAVYTTTVAPGTTFKAFQVQVWTDGSLSVSDVVAYIDGAQVVVGGSPEPFEVTVSLPESGAGAEALLGVRQVAVAEAGTAGEAVEVAASADLPQPGSGADTVTVAAVLAPADAGAAGEVLAVAAALPLAQPGTAGDALAVTAGVPQGDAGVGADTFAAMASVGLGDAADASDTVATGVPVPVADSATGAEDVAVTAAAPAAEQGAGADAVQIAVTASAGDAGSAGDDLAAHLIEFKAVADVGAAADGLTVTIRRDLGRAEPPRAAWTARGPRGGRAAHSPRTARRVGRITSRPVPLVHV